MNNSENRRLRGEREDIRNIRTTAATTPASPGLSTAASYLTSVTTWSPPVEARRHQSSQSKYKSAEANYLALRRNNNYKARQYSSTTSTSPGMSTLVAITF